MSKMNETCPTEQERKPFRELIRTAGFWKPVTAVILGGIGGYLYYHFVGCSSGSCGITSNPYSSVLFGAAIGFFLVNRPCSAC
jgi:urea transporter